jgi:hypothetical protein
MIEGREINYAELIDRLLGDFRPVKRLWPVGLRLAVWVLLGAAIVGIGAAVAGGADLWEQFQQPARLFASAPILFATIAAAYLALRSAIPDRAATVAELSALALTMAGVLVAAHFAPAAAAESLRAARGPGLSAILRMAGLATGPSLALFWAVRRGFPVQALTTAGLIGVAGCGFALLALQLSFPLAEPSAWQVISAGTLIIALAMCIGARWLNPAHQGREHEAIATESSVWDWIGARAIVPVALAVSVAIAIFIPRAGQEQLARIPDFDLAITSYQRSLTSFRSNVPSGSVDAVLTAYVEHGMPAYMWDFGPDGFRLVGGRFDRLPDGTPLTFTWFRGQRSGVMCMFKRTNAFIPPAVAHEENHHLFFYRYKGYSVCLINVGGYGNFISVIVAPMPLKEFMPLVLKAAL